MAPVKQLCRRSSRLALARNVRGLHDVASHAFADFVEVGKGAEALDLDVWNRGNHEDGGCDDVVGAVEVEVEVVVVRML